MGGVVVGGGLGGGEGGAGSDDDGVAGIGGFVVDDGFVVDGFEGGVAGGGDGAAGGFGGGAGVGGDVGGSVDSVGEFDNFDGFGEGGVDVDVLGEPFDEHLELLDEPIY
ncbi:hypothetical protein AGMMS49992_34010 [Clostridia bacterium]|nr:hypothetical protein AGMMS49992_34010 [Clostridia bacterium]